MPYSVPVKPVLYDGHHYRSTLEARFACFMNTLGVDYTYEPDTHEFPLSASSPLLMTHPSKSVKYIPDFFLPDFNCFLEIKPKYPETIECFKAWSLAKQTQRMVVIMWKIRPKRGQTRFDSLAFFPDEKLVPNVFFAQCMGCDAIRLCVASPNARRCACGCTVLGFTCEDKIGVAQSTALQKRFN